MMNMHTTCHHPGTKGTHCVRARASMVHIFLDTIHIQGRM